MYLVTVSLNREAFTIERARIALYYMKPLKAKSSACLKWGINFGSSIFLNIKVVNIRRSNRVWHVKC